MFDDIVKLLQAFGTASLPFLVGALFYLGKSMCKFDKSITILANSVEDLTKRLERLEEWMFQEKK